MLSFIPAIYIKVMREIILVPTSHVARQSLEKVKEVISKEKPDCVAVELDINRYYAMKEGESSGTEAFRTLGPPTFLFYWILRQLQSWFGRRMGILPGSEMMRAVDIARTGNVKVAFIDRDIRVTLMRVRKIPSKEKVKLLLYILKGLTIDYLLLRMKKGEAVDLSRVPPKEIINQAMEMMRKEFPQLYTVLVKERDHYMAVRLKQLSKQFGKIVAVTGAGHTDGLRKLLGN
jgi:pheromone shutdown-related protein TraB